jgi:hypothetical protein
MRHLGQRAAWARARERDGAGANAQLSAQAGRDALLHTSFRPLASNAIGEQG